MRASSSQLGLFDQPEPDVDLDGPIVCRVPTREEQRAMAEEFPEYVRPWPPVAARKAPYHCEGCGAGPGELHGVECDDAGARVPTVAKQQAQLRAAGEPVEEPARKRRSSSRVATGPDPGPIVRHIESAVRHGNLESARDALKTLGPRHPHRARLEQLIAAGRERDDEFDPWGAQ